MRPAEADLHFFHQQDTGATAHKARHFGFHEVAKKLLGDVTMICRRSWRFIATGKGTGAGSRMAELTRVLWAVLCYYIPHFVAGPRSPDARVIRGKG